MKIALTAFGIACATCLPVYSATISGAGDPGSAVTGGTVEDFESAAAGLYDTLTFGNVTITGVDAPFTIGSAYAGNYNTTGSQSLYNDFDYVPLSIKFSFATAVEAFAFNWGAADTDWTLAAYDAASNLLESFVLTPTFGSNAGEYYGISASGIAYATLIGTSDDYVFIDNFTSTTVAPVPVPATFSLLALGLGGLAFMRRRRA